MTPSSESAEEELHSTSERIARLLDEIRGAAGPQTWQAVEELVERLVGLYGAALSRVARAVEEEGAQALQQRLVDDELISSLFRLHGLHPLPPRVRLERAIEEIRPRLISMAKNLRLVEGGDQEAHLAFALADNVPRHRSKEIEAFVRAAVEEAAPELAHFRITVDGADLVQIRVRP